MKKAYLVMKMCKTVTITHRDTGEEISVGFDGILGFSPIKV